MKFTLPDGAVENAQVWSTRALTVFAFWFVNVIGATPA